MKFLLALLLFWAELSGSNLFTITDKHGHVVKSKQLHPTHNASLAQKASEYSLQALYDELHYEERMARLAETARVRRERIAKAKEEAKKAGKKYHISEMDRSKLLQDAKLFKGGRYIWGGTSPKGFDCSGYVQYLYKKHHISLPRTAYAQSKQGTPVDRKHLKKGDLLFFLTDPSRGIPVTHVGIYLGNGQFIHAASTKKGIIVSPIDKGYYARKFILAKRVIQASGS